MAERKSDRFERSLESFVSVARSFAELVFLVAVFQSAATVTNNLFLGFVAIATALALAAFGALMAIKVSRPIIDRSSGLWYLPAASLGVGVAWAIGKLSTDAVQALLTTALTKA